MIWICCALLLPLLLLWKQAVSAAADQLKLSPPYISQLISDLEQRLGRQLLYRSTRKIAISSDGQRFCPWPNKSQGPCKGIE